MLLVGAKVRPASGIVGELVGVPEGAEVCVGTVGAAVGAGEGETGAGVRLEQLTRRATKMKKAARKAGISTNQKITSLPRCS